MGFTETWLDSSILEAEMKIDNYSCVRKDRDRHGGGVYVFVSKEVAFNERLDLMHDDKAHPRGNSVQTSRPTELL